MRATPLVLVLVLSITGACASHARVQTPTAGARQAAEEQALDAADTLTRRGCLDCLQEAFLAYETIRVAPSTSAALVTRAATGSVRTALLIEQRERELGMSDEGYLQRARDVLSAHAELDQTYQTLTAMLDTFQWRSSRGVGSTDPTGRQRFEVIQANRAAWLNLLQTKTHEDELMASLWIGFSCANNAPAARQPSDLFSAVGSLRERPAVVYAVSICGLIDDRSLIDLLREEARFKEVEFWLGIHQLAQQHLGEAHEHLSAALEWRSRWPAVALTLADISMTAEDLNGALRLYEKTLSLTPDLPDATLGRVRALSFLGRHADALAGVADLDRTRWLPGEAAYWRAWNEDRLGHLEEAWIHVQQAELLGIVADVSKLAGIIAVKRGELPVARGRFETARDLNAADCETLVRLGGVHADLRAWTLSADVFIAGASCLEDAKAEIAQQIAALAASSGSPERVARQTASRRQQLASADRMLAQSWFNIAADYFNLSRKVEARTYAEKVVEDPQFGARARELIERLGN